LIFSTIFPCINFTLTVYKYIIAQIAGYVREKSILTKGLFSAIIHNGKFKEEKMSKIIVVLLWWWLTYVMSDDSPTWAKIYRFTNTCVLCLIVGTLLGMIAHTWTASSRALNADSEVPYFLEKWRFSLGIGIVLTVCGGLLALKKK